MAEEPENRMLFDLRGRRKRVIQVIYVILAFIMAASLVVIGLPGGINPFGNSTTVNTDAAEANIERANDLEQRLQTTPNNQNVARELIRARFSAARSLYETNSETGQTQITDGAITQYNEAAEVWNRYLKISKNQPDPDVAQLMSGVFFDLSQGSTVAQFQSNMEAAAKAQQFVVDEAVREQEDGGPSAANQLTTLAMYQFYGQNFAAAEKTRKQALAATTSEQDRKNIERSLTATEKDAKRVGKQIKQAIKQAQKDGGKSLENPLGGLGSGGPVGGAPTP